MRRVLKVPFKSHRGLTPFIGNQLPIELIIYKRILKFYCSLLDSDNQCLKFLADRCIGNSTSNMGRNINFFISKYGLNPYQNKKLVLKQLADAYISEWIAQNGHFIPEASVCMEMILVRDNFLACNLDLSECLFTLEELITN